VTEFDYARKLDELDRLLNDPDAPMEPSKVWSLLAEIAAYDLRATAQEDASEGAPTGHYGA
jgi:hypothetical protein